VKGADVRYPLLIVCIAFGSALIGDDRAREEAAEAEKLCTDELARWKLSADGIALDNPKEPVLRWTNPAVGRLYGNTYVWLDKGQPAAVGSLFRNFEPWNTFNGELTALTGKRLVAERGGKVLWQPEGQWKWLAIPGAPVPRLTMSQRLVQMRALIAEFEVEVLDTRNNRKGDEQTPRLLPRPLYRYDAAQTRTLDGALFAFVLGTDPELMVLLECDTVGSKPEWQFGVARMNRDAIRLKHKGKTVWEAESFRKHKPEDPYYFFGLAVPRREARP
jgi:hypothetical protein